MVELSGRSNGISALLATLQKYENVLGLDDARIMHAPDEFALIEATRAGLETFASSFNIQCVISVLQLPKRRFVVN